MQQIHVSLDGLLQFEKWPSGTKLQLDQERMMLEQVS